MTSKLLIQPNSYALQWHQSANILCYHSSAITQKFAFKHPNLSSSNDFNCFLKILVYILMCANSPCVHGEQNVKHVSGEACLCRWYLCCLFMPQEKKSPKICWLQSKLVIEGWCKNDRLRFRPQSKQEHRQKPVSHTQWKTTWGATQKEWIAHYGK